MLKTAVNETNDGIKLKHSPKLSKNMNLNIDLTEQIATKVSCSHAPAWSVSYYESKH